MKGKEDETIEDMIHRGNSKMKNQEKMKQLKTSMNQGD
jgi:hypothetical protein